MNTKFKELVPKDFNLNSHVWIYQSDRPFTFAEAIRIEETLKNFAQSWKSHGTPIKGYANLILNQFVVFMADETASGVSGCSTDSSVRIVKNIEKDFQVNMFDRQMLAFIIEEKIHLLPLSQINTSLESGFITTNTLFFNNTILTKEEWLNKWIIPVKNSWLAVRLAKLKQAK